jgi:radical SAM superfamily enzyme YgiQ (UPF0313 family)
MPLLDSVRGFAAPRWKEARPDADLGPGRPGVRALRVYFVKPSRYDDDGSVLRFRWGVIPSNTLIVLAGLNAGYARQRPEIDVQTVLWDELVDGLFSGAIIASIRERARQEGVEPIIALAGVQTNQYPRARDIALQCRRLGLTVLMGGFHVSSHEPTRRFLMSVGVTVGIGEAETTWPVLLDDYLRGRLELSYQVSDGVRARTGTGEILVPAIGASDLPAIDARYMTRFFNPTFSTIDTSRGCPFVCSYCSVKNVMGRTMRTREAGAVVSWLADAYDRLGVRNILIVDDDFFRSPAWEEILTGMAGLRRQRPDLSCILQTDLEASLLAWPEAGEGETPRGRRSRRFVELAAEAGCFEAFIGLESFDPANLDQATKFHNEDRRDRKKALRQREEATRRVKARYRRAVDAWHRVGVGVHAGYIIGMPFDGPGCGKQAAQDLAEIGVDIASFFAYTPLPGTEEHDRAVADGSLVSEDFNEYDSTHFVRTHQKLSPSQLRAEYDDAYRGFYTWRRLLWSVLSMHRVRGLSRAARLGMLSQQLYFGYAVRRGWHPMMGGIWRLASPVDCRRARSDEEAALLYLGLPVSSIPSRVGHGPRVGASSPPAYAGTVASDDPGACAGVS